MGKIQNLINLTLLIFARHFDKLVYGAYYNFPFGKKPRATETEYLKVWESAKDYNSKSVMEYEEFTNEEIDINWLNNLGLMTQVTMKKSKVVYEHGKILYATLKVFLKENNLDNINIFETGTARGFSALCMAKALSDSGSYGKIITFDLLPNDIKMYWNCIADLKGANTRQELLKDYHDLLDKYLIFIQGDTGTNLKKVSISRIHFAYLDGVHTYERVMNEFKLIQEKQKPKDLILFDDYQEEKFPGVVKAVKKICSEFRYSVKREFVINEERGQILLVKN